MFAVQRLLYTPKFKKVSCYIRRREVFEIWRKTPQNKLFTDIVEFISTRFNVTSTSARKSLSKFVKHICEQFRYRWKLKSRRVDLFERHYGDWLDQLVELPEDFRKLIKIKRDLCVVANFCSNKGSRPTTSFLNAREQMECIKSLEEPITQWSEFKTNVLNKKGSINEKNFDGVVLKHLINTQKFKSAVSYAEYLQENEKELSLGSINGLLVLYYEMAKRNQLTDKERSFILENFKSLYDKYKVLDYSTCEKLLHALCAIGEVKKCYKLLEDIQVCAIPSHSAYSTLIATLFDLNKKSEAIELIQQSLANRRPLQDNAYDSWIKYICKKYKQNKIKAKHMEEICFHIANNFVTISEVTALKIKETYESLGWKGKFVTIRKQNGHCNSCNEVLDCLKLTNDEFNLLQNNIKDKLIIGSDLFLKSSPDELKRFSRFIEETAPYDIVLDALNIALAVGRNQHNMNKVELLCHVVNHFREKNKKILLLGRKHMLSWPMRPMKYITSNTCSFFTENMSQDDPYFITAAIMSGPDTYIVSKDLFRGHLFKLQDDNLRQVFRRWLWQHQYMVFMSKNGRPVIQPPLKFTPCAQKTNNIWHLPYEKENLDTTGQVHYGVAEWSNWLCIQPDVTR